jgi:hypothetical protein
MERGATTKRVVCALAAVLLLGACVADGPPPGPGPIDEPWPGPRPGPAPINPVPIQPGPGPIDEPGVVPGNPGPGPIDDPGPGPIDGPGRCDPSAAMFGAGRVADDRLLAEMRRRSGARTVRVIPAGARVTQEYVYGRLNVIVDTFNRIMDVTCG